MTALMNDANNAVDNAGFQNTDDADALLVLAAVRHCANSWVGSVRLLGNVRACDISRACTEALAALSTPNVPEREAIALDHLGNALYYAAAIHPDHRNQAIENAIAYYNVARPNAQVDPNEHASLRTYDPILAVRLDEAAIRKDEREKCAKVAERCALDPRGRRYSDFGAAREDIASAIRNGGRQP